MTDQLGPYLLGPNDTTECGVYQGDILDLIRRVPTASVDLGIADPPYFKIAGGDWDHQWKSVDEWADWCQQWAAELCRVLKDNGSAYLFGDDKNIAYMQVRTDKLGWGLLNSIVWSKTNYTMLKADPDAMRSYRPQGEERILFYGRDEASWSERLSGDTKAFVPIREYLRSELQRSGLTSKHIGQCCGVTSRMIDHYLGTGDTVQWCLPTAERYKNMRQCLNAHGRNGGSYLARPHDELRGNYEYLRREYEYLRREYEELRRPFTGGRFTDVWSGPLMPGPQKRHECEKPQWLIRRMIECSSKPGAVVLDLFAGSGAVAEACIQMDRRYLSFEVGKAEVERARAALRVVQPAWPELVSALGGLALDVP